VFIYSTGAEFPENVEPLKAALQEAKIHLAVTSLEHKQLLRALENIQYNQQVSHLTVMFCLTK